MKRLAILTAVLPGAASAHGFHGHVAERSLAHIAAHAGPAFAIAAIVLGLVYVLKRTDRS